jgi:hypothetical protein
MAGDSITTGNIQGTGIAVGTGATANVVTNQATQKELTDLLSSLREQVQKADIPENAKQVVLTGPVQQMETAAHSPDPKPQIQHAMERLNDQLQVLGVTAKNVEGIVSPLAKIASIAGVALHALPFLASLL